MAVESRREGSWPVYSVRPNIDGAPAAGRPLPVVVYLHGGGWVREITKFHWWLVAQLASEVNAEIVMPIYPLVPFGTATDALDGVRALVASALARTSSVAIAGDSAGGQIALSAALALRDRETVLSHTALISPAVDLTWSNPRIPAIQPTDPWLGVPGGKVLAEAWRGDLPLTDPVVSPLHGDLTGLGPVSIFTGTRDILNPDAHVLHDRLHEARVAVSFHEVAGQLHVYPLLPTKTGQQARALLVSTLRTAL